MAKGHIAEKQPKTEPQTFNTSLESLLETQASRPLLDKATDLIDQKYELTRIKQQIEEELARIDADLKEQMVEGEVLYGTNGVGYKLSTAHYDIYGEDVVQQLDSLHLLPMFAKVSTARLKELVRDGYLSWEAFHEIRKNVATREVTSLREVVSPHARIL